MTTTLEKRLSILPRFDTVGSFLRPVELKKARADFDAGQVTADQLETVTNSASENLVSKEINAGLKVVTDGEFRRYSYMLDTTWGFDGVEKVKWDHGFKFNDDKETAPVGAKLTGKIKFSPDHPDVKAFRFLNSLVKDKAGVHARQSLPSPAQVLEILTSFNTDDQNQACSVYANRDDLIQDLGTAFHDLILAFYDEGCRDVKLDDTSWGYFLNTRDQKAQENQDFLNHLAGDLLAVNNLALKDLPDDLTVSTHFCRGNFRSEYLFSGGYDRIARYLFKGEPRVDAFFLEYDDPRSGSFAPLADIDSNKRVVLGLVTSKRPQLEKKADVIKRIREASKYVPLDHLAVSPQCGFASTEEGNALTEEDQWNKIKLLREVAENVW